MQYADWPLLCRQSELKPMMERLAKAAQGKLAFRDLRKEVFQRTADNFMLPVPQEPGDPLGYQEVELGLRSHLEAISDAAERFAVNDYSIEVTRSNHRRGSHRYFISRSILDADLFINLPKWKSHSKSGITGALKNLVGINGDKAYLPHFRRGAPAWGGDEYGNENRWLYWAQTTVREKLQKRNQWAYHLLKPGWELIKRVRGIETRLDNPNAHPKRFYVAGGAWPGNDTIWRMIYDLNLVIQCVDSEGCLKTEPQRNYFCMVDGLISGEGNGPLQPLPRETDWLICGSDPFAIDASLSWFMGFDPHKVPVIEQRHRFAGMDWGQFKLADLTVELNGKPTKVLESALNFRFASPPGWRSHIER